MKILNVAMLIGTLVLVATGRVDAADAKRPNILFAFADDWGRYASIFAAVEGAGSINDAIKTPNIDRIAREGVLFRQAYVNAPSSTPCRSSMLSGQYFWRTGRAAILQRAVWDAKIPSFPLLLHDAGYHIGQTYKVWSPGTPNDAPFGGERFAYEKAGGRFNNFSENVTQMVKKGQPLEEAKAELYRDVTGNFEAYLADRKKDQPFCYWFGPTKAWLIKHRADPEWKPFYDLAFAKRPREQLFVIADDPHQLHNVAADPKYESVPAEFKQKLMSELTRTNDPRVTGDKHFFETPPMAGPLAEPRGKKKI